MLKVFKDAPGGERSAGAGFTLVELLVVVAILAVLAAIAIPLFLNQREKAAEGVLISDVRNAGGNLSSLISTTSPDAGSDIVWDQNTETFTINGESIPNPVSETTTLSVVGNTNGWCIKATNNDGQEGMYGSNGGVGACNVWTSTPALAGAPDAEWRSAAYGNGKFVAVAYYGSGARIAVSEDGETWSAATEGVNLNDWYSIAYGDGKFVAVAYNGSSGSRVMTSVNGTTWAEQSTGVQANVQWFDVTYANEQFVAVGGAGKIMTSPNGVDWTMRTAPRGAWTSLTYGGNKFVAVSSFGPSAGKTLTSSDGINWVGGTNIGTNTWQDITYGNGLFVAVSSNGDNRLATSPDGINWTFGEIPLKFWYGVTYGEGKFVAVAGGAPGEDLIITSTDGVNWSSSVAPEEIKNGNGYLFGVAYGDGVWVGVGGGTYPFVKNP